MLKQPASSAPASSAPASLATAAPQPDFQAFQHDFARYLRDPAQVDRPAHVSDRAAGIYARLLYGNLRAFVDRCFPLSQAILGEAQWQTLTRKFYRDCPLHSPVFRDMLADFVDFLNSDAPLPDLPPWLPELAHFEWLEMAVALAPNPQVQAQPDGDLMNGCPVTRPGLVVLNYHWPVHRINANWQPETPEPSYLLVHRDDQFKFRVHQSNPTTLRLLSFLDGKTSGHDALQALAAEIGYQPVSELLGFGAALLTELRQLGVVCGSNPNTGGNT